MRRLVLTLALLAPAAAVAFPPSLAPPADVLALARECALPPTRPGEDVFRVDQMPFLASALKDYATDVPLDAVAANPDRYKLRATVLGSFKSVREVWATTPELPVPKIKKLPLLGKKAKATPNVFLTRVTGPITAAFKDEVKAYQVFPATGILKLETALAALQTAAPLRDKEPKRWRAHFDYAVAQCTARVAFLNEYDLALGYVLREELPDLDAKKGQDGWRMVPAETMKSKRDVKAMAEAARGAFEKLTADHKGTPWAALAARELTAPPGLKWEAVSSK